MTGVQTCALPIFVVANSLNLQNYPAANYAIFMSGLPYIQSPVKDLIVKPLPWLTFLILATVASALVACAARITHQQDF